MRGTTTYLAYQFQSVAHSTCIVVQNASTGNGANLITHACTGDNSWWVEY